MSLSNLPPGCTSDDGGIDHALETACEDLCMEIETPEEAQFLRAALRSLRTPELKNPTLLGKRWKHRKGGTYRVVATGIIEATLLPAVIYEAEKDGIVWVRPFTEFMDGRFTCID